MGLLEIDRGFGRLGEDSCRSPMRKTGKLLVPETASPAASNWATTATTPLDWRRVCVCDLHCTRTARTCQ